MIKVSDQDKDVLTGPLTLLIELDLPILWLGSGYEIELHQWVLDVQRTLLHEGNMNVMEWIEDARRVVAGPPDVKASDQPPKTGYAETDYQGYTLKSLYGANPANYRSSDTGEYITREAAEAAPKESERERRTRPAKSRKATDASKAPRATKAGKV